MQRILVLAHREELIYQAVAHAENAGLDAGMEMGSHRARRETVIVSTVQTLNSIGKCRPCNGSGCDMCKFKGRARRMTKFDPFEFGLVITDEGHHATAKSYRAIYEYFRRNPELKMLFVTATPQRSDGVGLHNVCDSVAYEMDLRAAIADGWLCPIRQRFVTCEGLDLSRVKTKMGGDLADGELERAFLGNDDIEEERLLHSIAKPTIDEARGQQGIVFASGCEHAEKLTAAFNAYDGVSAELILGTTNKDERRRIVQRFKDKQVQFLVNVGVATEGFDCPAAAVVAVARPTASASLYLQMIGRGTRPLPGVVDGPETAAERLSAIASSAKPAAVILDFVGNSGKHKLVSVADVLAGDDVDPVDLAAVLDVAKSSGETVDAEELLERVKQAREERLKREEEMRNKVVSTRTKADSAEYYADDVDIFEGRRFDPFDDYSPAPDGATPKQVAFLIKLGVSAQKATTFTKRQAGKVIDQLTSAEGGEFRVTFGKHAGKKLKQLPSGYVRWAYDAGVGGQKFRDAVDQMNGKSQPTLEEAPF